MDADDQAADVAPETPAIVDPDAPFGRREDGTAFKRDPSFFAHLRKGATGKGRTTSRRNAPGGVKPAPAVKPAASRRGAKPDYARKIMELARLGLAFVPDPVDRLIVETQLPPIAQALDKAAGQYEWLAQLLDKVLLAGGGLGPLSDVLLAGGTCAGLLALNHGNRHPLLVALLGAQLQTLTVQAMQQQQHRDQEAEQLRALLQQEGHPE